MSHRKKTENPGPLMSIEKHTHARDRKKWQQRHGSAGNDIKIVHKNAQTARGSEAVQRALVCRAK